MSTKHTVVLPAAVWYVCLCVRAMWKLSNNRETHSQNIYLMAAATKISLLLNDAAMMVWELGRKRAAASLWLMRNDFNGYIYLQWDVAHSDAGATAQHTKRRAAVSAPPLCAQRCKSARNFSVCSRDAGSPLLQLRVRPSRVSKTRVLFGAQNEAIFQTTRRSLLMHEYNERFAFYTMCWDGKQLFGTTAEGSWEVKGAWSNMSWWIIWQLKLSIEWGNLTR